MNRIIRLLPLCVLASSPAFADETIAKWDFIESLGGMAVRAAEPAENGWTLPVECDITGLRRISVDPTHMNSSQVIEQLRWRVEDDRLVLTMTLKPSSYATDEARCQPLQITDVKRGEYEVVYSDGSRTVPLGKVRFR